MLNADLTCFLKMLKNLQKLETSALRLFPWTPVMFWLGSAQGKHCWMSDLDQRLKSQQAFVIDKRVARGSDGAGLAC